MTESYLVNTGVFLRWYVDQNGFEHAREIQQHFLDGGLELQTVDFVCIELAEVLRKKGYLAKLLTRDECLAAARDLDDLGIEINSTSTEILQVAVGLAVDRNLRVFDALLVAHALIRKVAVLTADAKLCKAVDGVVHTTLLDGVVIHS